MPTNNQLTQQIMMIAFITIKRSLVSLIEGLCAQVLFGFEISVLRSHFGLFLFGRKDVLKGKKAGSPRSHSAS